MDCRIAVGVDDRSWQPSPDLSHLLHQVEEVSFHGELWALGPLEQQDCMPWVRSWRSILPPGGSKLEGVLWVGQGTTVGY